MNNKERCNQIIDGAYENYSKEYEKDNSIGLCLLVKRLDGKSTYRKPDKEMFVTMCEFDEMFSEIWGLKIEERELTQRERVKLLYKAWELSNITPEHEEVSSLWVEYNNLMSKYSIPTRLITLTYNNETIESYE